MSIAQKAIAHRQFFHSIYSIVERVYIINYVVYFEIYRHVNIGIKHVFQSCLRSFNLATEQCFFTDVCAQKQVHIGDKFGNHIQLAEIVMCLRKQRDHFSIHFDFGKRWQRIWSIRFVTGNTAKRSNILSCSVHTALLEIILLLL